MGQLNVLDVAALAVVFLSLAGRTAVALRAGTSATQSVEPRSLTLRSSQRRGKVSKSQCWEHALYMSADNNLEHHAVRDMEELVRNRQLRSLTAAQYKFRVLMERSTYVDRYNGYTSEEMPGLGYQPEMVVEATLNESAHNRELKRLWSDPKAPLTDPAQLTSFIKKALPLSTECNQFLELWDHGMGSFGFGSADDFDAHGMPVKELASALKEAGREERKVDLLGFDACYMSSYEVIEALSPYARRFIVSEETEPGHGWDYERTVWASDAKTLGQNIINAFVRSSYQSPRTLALVSTDGFLELRGHLNQLCDLMTAHLGRGLMEAERVLGTARQRALSFGSPVDTDKEPGSHIDLGSFLESLKANIPDSWHEEVGLLERATHSYSRQVFDYSGYGQEATFAGYTGMSVFFPSKLANHIHWKMHAYADALGEDFGRWGQMVRAYVRFEPKEGAVYRGDAPKAEEARSEHGAGEPLLRKFVGEAVDSAALDREIYFYGARDQSVTEMVIMYGQMDDDDVMHVAGIVRPDLSFVDENGLSGWWVELQGLSSTFDGMAIQVSSGHTSPVTIIRDDAQSFENVNRHMRTTLVKIPITYWPDASCMGNELEGYLEGQLRQSFTNDVSYVHYKFERGISLYIKRGHRINAVETGGSFRTQNLVVEPGADVHAVPTQKSPCFEWSRFFADKRYGAGDLEFNRIPSESTKPPISFLFRVVTERSEVHNLVATCAFNGFARFTCSAPAISPSMATRPVNLGLARYPRPEAKTEEAKAEAPRRPQLSLLAVLALPTALLH